ncbi:MAG: FAD:protein FMN transferase [Deltaproteobacteria bacterium]|nr:FAD:protein FMN transferase [Deltaproteobacteria bacterium]
MKYFLLLTLFLFISSADAAPQRFLRQQIMMGDVPVTIKIVAESSQKDQVYQAMEEAFDEERRLEKQLSEFQPESELNRLHRQAGKGATSVGADLIRLLLLSQKVSELTQGAFDITFASKDRSTSYRDIEIDSAENKVTLKKKRTWLGVSGIAKGYIIDRMIDVLHRRNFPNALVNGGGDLRATGVDLQGAWKIGIQDPGAPRGEKVCNLRLSNLAVSTSGAYERGPHIVNPKTKEPVHYWRSVSVFAEEAGFADGLATGGFVMGPAAITTLSQIQGIGAVLIDSQGKVTTLGAITAACFQ